LFVTMLTLSAAQAAPAGTAAPARPPLDRLNAADNARARSAVTRLADLVTGFRADRSAQRLPLIPHCDGYPGDRSHITITGEAASSYRHSSNSIASKVMYFRSYADAEAYWSTTAKPKFVDCLARWAEGGWRTGSKTRTMLAKRIPIGATSAEHAVAYRTITRVAEPNQDPFVWTETVAFVKQTRAVGIVRVVYVDHLCDCHTGLALDVTRRIRAAR
jgi:hypothetical protein